MNKLSHYLSIKHVWRSGVDKSNCKSIWTIWLHPRPGGSPGGSPWASQSSRISSSFWDKTPKSGTHAVDEVMAHQDASGRVQHGMTKGWTSMTWPCYLSHQAITGKLKYAEMIWNVYFTSSAIVQAISLLSAVLLSVPHTMHICQMVIHHLLEQHQSGNIWPKPRHGNDQYRPMQICEAFFGVKSVTCVFTFVIYIYILYVCVCCYQFVVIVLLTLATNIYKLHQAATATPMSMLLDCVSQVQKRAVRSGRPFFFHMMVTII